MALSVQKILKQADAVCFDVDSTVIREEGIDELAKFCNKGDEVAKLTTKAMTGSVSFQEALKLRLDIIRPSHIQVRQFLKTCLPTLTPGISKLVAKLRSRNVDIHLISGGFECVILPIADQLHIPFSNIHANRLTFYYNGDYAGFDVNRPTSKSGGKAVVINDLKSSKSYKHLILVGDGATDLEACPPADGFIGFGGNVIRTVVKENAKWFVTDFQEIINVLDN